MPEEVPESICADLLEHCLDAAFVTRPDGKILFANPAARALFGYTEQELQALGRAAVVDASDPRLAEALAQRRATGRFQGMLRMKRKDGSRLSVVLSSAVYATVGGEQRTAMFVGDLSDQEQREQALQVANEELTRTLAEVRQLRGILPICSYCKSIRNDTQ